MIDHLLPGPDPDSVRAWLDRHHLTETADPAAVLAAVHDDLNPALDRVRVLLNAYGSQVFGGQVDESRYDEAGATKRQIIDILCALAVTDTPHLVHAHLRP